MTEELVGPQELASALDVSTRHVYRLREAGMPKRSRGAYPLAECASWYRRHVLSPNGNGDSPDLSEARLAKARVRAAEAERELERRKQQVVPAEIEAEHREELYGWIREAVTDLAPDLAEALDGADDPAEVLEVLENEVRAAMEGLQDGPEGLTADGEGEDGRRAA